MESHALPDSPCPVCGYAMDAATTVSKGGDGVPSWGDLSLCINCGAMLEFDHELRHRVLTPERFEKLPADLRAKLTLGQRAVHAMNAAKAPRADPFEKPQEVNVDDASPVARALRRFKATPPVLIATPSTQPRNVIGATLGPSCDRCGTRVWLAPSSQKYRSVYRSVFCQSCLLAALLPSEREQVHEEWTRIARSLLRGVKA